MALTQASGFGGIGALRVNGAAMHGAEGKLAEIVGTGSRRRSRVSEGLDRPEKRRFRDSFESRSRSSLISPFIDTFIVTSIRTIVR